MSAPCVLALSNLALGSELDKAQVCAELVGWLFVDAIGPTENLKHLEEKSPDKGVKLTTVSLGSRRSR